MGDAFRSAVGAVRFTEQTEMIRHHVHVPCYGPQILAFPIDRAQLAAFREGIRAVVERGDLGRMKKLWEASSPGYFERRRRVRWRASASAVHGLCTDATELAAALGRDTLAERIKSAKARFHDVSHVDVSPDGWLSARTSASDALRLGAGADSTLAFVQASHLEMFVEALEEIQRGGCPDWARSVPEGPSGDLSWLSSLRFRDEDTPETSTPRPYPRHVRDRIVAPEPSRLPEWVDCVASARELVQQQVAAHEILEVLVGPFHLSRGPGTFRPLPSAARPVEAPKWTRLPLFDESRSSNAETFTPICDVHVLEGGGLRDAIREILDAEPTRAWWDDMEIESFDELFAFDENAPWLSWASLKTWWPACRDRFIELLQEAADSDRAVLLDSYQYCDQAPHGAPLTAGDGEPILVEPSGA